MNLNTGRWTRFYEVEEDGREFTFSAVDMWFRKVCDEYLDLPVFPAMPLRELYGCAAQGIEPYMQPKLGPDGAPILIDGEPYMHSISGTAARPGAVWMTRKLILDAWSDFFNIRPDPHLFDDMKSIDDNRRVAAGGDPHRDYDGRYYHPATDRFNRQVRNGRLFTPHDTVVLAKHGLPAILAEQFSYHNRRVGGTAPKSIGQYMLDPDYLDEINRSHVWDVFVARRQAFEIEKLAVPVNTRMHSWRELCDHLDQFPVFDRETILRVTADPKMWGKDAATARTVDNHMTKWLKADRIRIVSRGLYRPVRQNFEFYKPFGDHFLADWLEEFIRRQAARQRMLPAQTFTFETMRDDISRFHADWQKFHRAVPNDATMRQRLNAETVGFGDGRGTWIEKINAKERRLTPATLDLFAPAEAEFFKRNGPRK